MENPKMRWKTLPLEHGKNGYPEWDTFQVRDAITNVHIATVGDVDNFYSGIEKKYHANVIGFAPETLFALEQLLLRCKSLDQTATHDGLLNCQAIAYARIVIEKIKEG